MISNPIKSPKGVLEYVYVRGEGRENLSGEMIYSVDVVIEPSDPVISLIDEFWKMFRPDRHKGREPFSNGIKDHREYQDENDSDGKRIYVDSGKKVMTFKTKTKFPDGKQKKVNIYNSKSKLVELDDGVVIGNGSVGIVSGVMGIYKIGPKAGVSLYLNSLQILKFVEYTGGDNFEEYEDGWTGEKDWTGNEKKENEEDYI